MAKVVIKVPQRIILATSPGGDFTRQVVVYYDTLARVATFKDFKYTDSELNNFDWSLIYAYNTGLNNDWKNIDIANNSYNIQDADTGGGVNVHAYCEIPDEKVIDSTNNLHLTGDNDGRWISEVYLATVISTTTNAGSCAVTLNDLEIENVYVSYSGSTADVQIVASGTNTPFTYCLGDENSSTCQLGDTFTGLDASEQVSLTLKVIDSAGYKRTATVLITPQAQYGDRWIVQFYNRSGDLCEAKIQQKGYVGATTYPDSLGNPVSINYREGSSSDAKYDVIKGSECNVTLVSSTSFEFLDLFEGEEDEFRLQYYRDSTLIWQGFSKNEGYSEAYQDVPYEISLTFIDGLGTLKDKQYLDSNGEIFRGIKSELNIVSTCLLSTLHQLPIWVSIDIFENDYDQTDADTPLIQSYLNTDLFIKEDKVDSCYEVLEKILISYGAQLYQQKGAWHIRCIDDIQNAYTQTKYTAYGQYDSNATYNPAATTTSATADPMIRFGAATLNVIPAFSKVQLEQQVEQRTNLITNGDFNLFESNGFYSNWNDSEGVGETFAINNGDESDNALFLRGDASQDTGGSLTTTIDADPRLITVSKDGTALNVSITFRVRAQNSTPTNGVVKFYIQVGAQILLKNGSWTNDTGLSASDYLYYDMNAENWGFNDLHTLNIQTKQLPDGGALQFKIYRPLGTGATFDGMDVTKIRINTLENAIKLPSKFDLSAENSDGNYTFSPDPLKLYISDWPQFDSPEAMLKNVRFKDAQGTTPTRLWNRLSLTTESTEIQNIILERFLANYLTPTQEIQGEIHCINADLDFSNTISDPNNAGKIFMIASMKTDEKEQIYEVTLLEILSEDLTKIFRILEDGTIRHLESSVIFVNNKMRIIE